MTIYKLTATLHYVAILHEHWKEREKGGDQNLTQGKTLKEKSNEYSAVSCGQQELETICEGLMWHESQSR